MKDRTGLFCNFFMLKVLTSNPGKIALFISASIFAIAVAGCSGGGGGSSNSSTATPKPTSTKPPTPTPIPTATPTPVPNSLSGTVIQGPMRGSAITVNAVDPATGANGAALGTTTTGSVDGTFSVIITPQTGPVRITATGGNYVSEMNGATISAPSAVSILLPSASAAKSGISINPLTTFIDTRTVALVGGGAPFATALTDATSQIEAIYGLNADPGTLIPSYTTTNNPQANLGLILGAIINEDQSLCPVTPGTLVTALAQDISDGFFDGIAAGKPVSYCGGNLPAIAGTIDFQDALSGLAQLHNVTQAFAFGGASNVLQTNGLVNLTANPPVIYPLAPLETINISVPHAAPSPVSTFAPSPQPTMEAPRYTETGTLLPNGKVLIAGGLGSGTGPNALASTEIYDPANGGSFAAGPNMSIGRANEAETLLPNGKILIAGGAVVDDVTWTNTTDLFDPANPTVIQAGPSLTFAFEGAAAALLPNGTVLIAGGQNSVSAGATLNNKADIYDPSGGPGGIGMVTELPSTLVVARYDAATVLLPNGKVMIFGGFGGLMQSGAIASTEIYDPATQTFSAGKPMLEARGAERATLLPNGKVLIAGGTNDGGVLNTAEVYDPVANTFTPVPGTMSSPRRFQEQVLLPNGDVLIAGGFTDSSGTNLSNTTDIYDSAAGTLAPGPAMNFGHGSGTANLLQSGKVLIAGGLSTNGQIADATDLYTP